MRGFNGNFYITTATVIPVLYLAMTVESQVYQRTIDRLRSSVREAEFKFWPQIKTSAWILASFMSAGVILFGVYAEYLALDALYTENTSATVQQSVLVAIVGLLILTAIGPFYTFITAHIGALNDNLKATKERGRQKGAKKSEGARASSEFDMTVPAQGQPEAGVEQRLGTSGVWHTLRNGW